MKQLTAILILSTLSALAQAGGYPDPAVWKDTIYGFGLEDEIIAAAPGAIVATGSSTMRFWSHRIHDDLSPLTVIPRGFGGSNMNDVLHYLDDLVLSHNPRAVIIYEGDNDVSQDVDTAIIISTYQEVIQQVHAFDPGIRIYLVSIKPSIARAGMWPRMQQINKALAALCSSADNLTFIDAASSMLKSDGAVMDDIFVADGLHLNQKGYDIWARAIAPLLIEREVRFEFAE